MSKQPPPAPTASAVGPCPTVSKLQDIPALEVYPAPPHHPTNPGSEVKLRSFYGLGFGLVVCFWFNGPLRQYFSLYRAVSQREG